MADFVSGFWNGYVMIITALSLVFCAFVLMSNNTKREEGPPKLHGHVWDEDLAEYNNPLPRWWFYLFWMTLLFGVAYLALYPGFGNFRGLLNWSATGQYYNEMDLADERYGPLFARYAEFDVEELAADPEAMSTGQRLFQTYCEQCHGADARGSRGFPNLTDESWHWGGDPESIRTTITGGRTGMMPALGAAIGADGVRNVAHYVRSLNGLAHESLRAGRGAEVFAQNCVACHGTDASGTPAMGAPALNDGVWLWGSSEAAIAANVNNGIENRMPGFGDFLGEDKVHVLTAYVWGLSQRTEED